MSSARCCGASSAQQRGAEVVREDRDKDITYMDAQEKAFVLHDVIGRRSGGGKEITPNEWRQFVEAQNDGCRTGPAIGEQAPVFTLPDQNGTRRTLQDLTGPGGLLLVFSRSADW